MGENELQTLGFESADNIEVRAATRYPESNPSSYAGQRRRQTMGGRAHETEVNRRIAELGAPSSSLIG